MKMTIAPALLCALALAACSDKPPPAQSVPTAAATTAQSSNAPWAAMKQDEQHAKDVAKQASQAQANEQQQIQQQTQ
jgi:outer membrane murein-binding lipoprotein Lpp